MDIKPKLSSVSVGFALVGAFLLQRRLPAAVSSRRVALLVGLVGCVAYHRYHRKVVNGSPPLVAFNESDHRMQTIVARCSTFKERFHPTFPFHGQYGQLLLLILHEYLHFGTITTWERVPIDLPDGGRVRVDWYHESSETGESLPEDAPVVCFLHTITGHAEGLVGFAKHATKMGWRVAVFNRRGHGNLKLNTTKFNLLGCVHDTQTMVEHVQARYPKSYLGMIGVSAGSGQLVSYLAHQQDHQTIRAAASLSPAYDITNAFDKVDEQYPLLSKYLVGNLKRLFLDNNHDLLKSNPAYEDVRNTDTVQGFLESHVRLAGFDTYEEYLGHSNPMVRFNANKVPCLVLNAKDDPICLEDNIRYDLAGETDNYCLVVTDTGSHIAFRDGWFGEECYMYRLAMDFLETARVVELENE